MNTYQHSATVLAGLLGAHTAIRLPVPSFMPLSVEDYRAIRCLQPDVTNHNRSFVGTAFHPW